MNLYKVSAIYGTELKEKPSRVKNKYKIDRISRNDIVLAGIPVATGATDSVWYPTLSINENGIEKGFVCGDSIELIQENVLGLEKENKKDENYIKQKNERIVVVNTERDGYIPLNMHVSPDVNSRKLAKIPNGTEIKIAVENLENTITQGQHNWIKIGYDYKTEDKKMHMNGYVDEAYLKEKAKIKRQVNAEELGGTLKLTDSPSDKGDVLLNIPDGYIMELYEDELEPADVGFFNKRGHDWIKVNVQGIDGYIDSKYLSETIDKSRRDIDEIEEFGEEIFIPYSLQNGKVIGIDFNGGNLKAEDLPELLNNGVGKYSSYNEDYIYSQAVNSQIPIDDINGKISYMYIKLGATRPVEEDIDISNRGFDQKLIDFCEKNHVPYGFYYFVGSKDKKEARQEFEYIKEKIDNQKSRKYNVLPIALDVEIGVDSRLHGDCTEAVVELTKLLQYSDERVMLYTAGNATLTEDKVIDLEEYNRRTGVKDLWFVYPRVNEKGYKSTHEKYYQSIPKCMDVIMTQEALDVMIEEKALDIDSISNSNFVNLVVGSGKNIKFVERKDIKELKKEKEEEHEL